MPGVERTDFAKIIDLWPKGVGPDYAFQTIVEWPDRETYEASFHSEESQSVLKENLKKLREYTFLVSEVFTGPES